MKPGRPGPDGTIWEFIASKPVLLDLAIMRSLLATGFIHPLASVAPAAGRVMAGSVAGQRSGRGNHLPNVLGDLRA